MAREDNYTSTVDGAAAHAAALDDHDWDWDQPTERELRAENLDYSTTPADPWATPGTTSTPPF